MQVKAICYKSLSKYAKKFRFNNNVLLVASVTTSTAIVLSNDRKK